MDLTPEERQRIYLEEKARVESRQRLLEEAFPEPKKKSGRLKWWLLGFLGLVIVGAILAQPNQPPPVAKTPAQVEADAKATKATLKACEKKLEKAKELDMLYDLGARGAHIKVLVGPTYFNVPIDVKQGFAEAVNCVVMRGSGGGVSFDLIHWQTGKRVASWNGYKLVVD